MNLACAVLAAGGSARLGMPKQLLPFDGSNTLVHWAAECACKSSASRVAVVVGARSEDIAASVANLPVEILNGSGWREGMAASIRTAALWAVDRGADALMLSVCDQPFLTSRHLNALWFASEHGKRLAGSYYGGKTCVPAVFPARYFGALLALRGEEGGSSILRRDANVARVAWPEGAFDIDTPADALVPL
ncbi:MAG TPA: nucleotidyltransferase family protein [Polyangiaceae bacterium]|nr:nucleotidyltransferase family protein [Polyangiaceae bacterium]